MANLRGTSQTYVHRCNLDGPLAVMTLSCAPRKHCWPATITIIKCLFDCRPDPVFYGVNRSYALKLDVELSSCPDCGASPEEDCAETCPTQPQPRDECVCGCYRMHHDAENGCTFCLPGTPSPDGNNGCRQFVLAVRAGEREELQSIRREGDQ